MQRQRIEFYHSKTSRIDKKYEETSQLIKEAALGIN
jgi:hypothetical protein